MKGVFVFSEANDISFIYTDEEYKVHLNKQAFGAGLIQESKINKAIDPNVVVQLFMPLIASNRFMVAQVNNPYSSITCENGFIFVFEQFGSLLLLGMNGDKTENEDSLRRKLLVFRKLIQFHFGPVIESLRPNSSEARKKTWKLFSRLLETWSELSRTEQSFLVEAVERLHVNQRLNAKCVDLLENALSQVRSAGDKYALHALLTVNTKLLALYSSRNACELNPADVLQMIMFVQNCFPHQQKLEDLFSMSYAKPEPPSPIPRSPETVSEADTDHHTQGRTTDAEQFESAIEGENSSDEQFYSPRTTPLSRRKSVPFVDGSILASTPIKEQSSEEDVFDNPAAEHFITPSSHVSHMERLSSQEGNDGDVLKNIEEDLNDTESEISINEKQSDFQQHSVFLHTPSCLFTPHILHCIEIVPGMALTIISEVPKSNLSGIICQTLNTLTAVMRKKSRAESAHLIVEQLNSHVKRLLEATKRSKGNVEKIMQDVAKRWENVKKNGFQEYLELHNKQEVPPRLENSIISMYGRLQELFKSLFLKPPEINAQNMPKFIQTVNYIQAYLRHELRDYKDYLAVKAQRNITMTTYLEDYPGLVHFIYVDRQSHQMTAPSINITETENDDSEDGKMDVTLILKERIWDMVKRIQSKLVQGYTSVTMREGDFLYSYYLWFEDSSGNPKAVQQPFHACSNFEIPGILTGRFYSNIVRQCFPTEPRGSIHCFELFCVHVGVVPTDYVQAHCKRLAAQIWETSGEARAPISLL